VVLRRKARSLHHSTLTTWPVVLECLKQALQREVLKDMLSDYKLFLVATGTAGKNKVNKTGDPYAQTTQTWLIDHTIAGVEIFMAFISV